MLRDTVRTLTKAKSYLIDRSIIVSVQVTQLVCFTSDSTIQVLDVRWTAIEPSVGLKVYVSGQFWGGTWGAIHGADSDYDPQGGKSRWLTFVLLHLLLVWRWKTWRLARTQIAHNNDSVLRTEKGHLQVPYWKKKFCSFEPAKRDKCSKYSLHSHNFLCSCTNEILKFKILLTIFVPNNKEEDTFSAGINICHHAVFTMINKCMLSPMDSETSSLIVLYSASRSKFPPQRGTQQCARAFMLLTGVRARTGLWRLPPVSEICHYHGETWGKGEVKNKMKKGCCRIFWNPLRCVCFGAGTHNRRRDLRPSNAWTGMQRRRL